MKRRISLFGPGTFPVILFLLCYALPTNATTYTAASCSAADVSAAIAKAADGDTVLVPGSTCGSGTPLVWSSTVTVSKGITLNGQGAYIQWPSSSPFGFLVVNPDTIASAFITGFNFLGGYAPGNPGCAVRLNLATPGQQPFRFHHNTLTNSSGGNGQTTLCGQGQGSGLIDHNTFTGTGEIVQNYGPGGGSLNDDPSWTSDVVPGSANMLFFEDNTFNNPDAAHEYGAINDYYGPIVAFRHNTLLRETVDAHGGNLNGGTGTRWMEIYQNTFNANTTSHCQSRLVDMRGGSGMTWGNHFASLGGSCNVPGIKVGPDSGSSDPQTGTWPLPWQVGRGINKRINLFCCAPSEQWNPFYNWGNDAGIPIGTNNGTFVMIGSTPASCSRSGSACDSVDYGSGTTAPPALLRCESAADLAAGCPVTYTYQPYIYPHPLTSGSPQPQPPTNLLLAVH